MVEVVCLIAMDGYGMVAYKRPWLVNTPDYVGYESLKNVVLLRYTGEKDVDEREIYVGHILHLTKEYPAQDVYGEVIDSVYGTCIAVKNNGKVCCYYFEDLDMHNIKYIIVGNVFQNGSCWGN